MFTRVELVYLQGRPKKQLTIRDGDSLQIQNYPGSLKWGQHVTVDLHHRDPLELLDFRMELPAGFLDGRKMMVNGFQSWSRSGEMDAADAISPLFMAARPLIAPYGDYRFLRYSPRRGKLHSWTYTYFREGDDVFFIGSVDEGAGYTLFEYDYRRRRLYIRRDCRGAVSFETYPLLRLYVGRGNLTPVLEEYFSLLHLPRRQAPRINGWTSWYNYYTGISEKLVRENLQALREKGLPLSVFQIDDGWQQGLGDWLEANEKFPSGMKAIAEEIKAAGMQPGLWLAPFVCTRSSRLFQENPQWVLRNRRGKAVKAGFNPLWGGWFYALDFGAPGFQEYLRRVFKRVQEEWGYRLLKLDFLYAAALQPGHGKSRGELMVEVMDFIHRHTRESRLLGCGVPLGPALGRVDYCRIGSDVAPYWEDRFLKAIRYRERVATENALFSTIGRSHLDRRAFRNDPDVFILRDGRPRVNLNRLDAHQRFTLFFLNNLLGGLIFFSDNVNEYTPEQLLMLKRSFPSLETQILRQEHGRGIYRYEFAAGGKKYLSLSNLTGREREVVLEEGLYFHPELFILRTGDTVRLAPFQTLCFYRVEPREGKAYLLGTAGHIYPGAQVEKLNVRGGTVALQLHPQASPESAVFLAVPRGVVTLQVNKRNYPVTLKDRVHFVVVPFEGATAAADTDGGEKSR